jgi:aminoglycoside 6-adenylyltransferase
MSDFKELIKQIKAWAAARPEMRAVIVVGSQARQQPPADEFSDLDLVLFSANADVYARDDSWLRVISTPWLAVRNTTGCGDPEWMVVFADGAKVDFVFSNLPDEMKTAPLAALLQRSPYGFVYQRGVRVLFDRENPENEGSFLTFPRQVQTSPMVDEYSQTVQRFFLQALRSARFLSRGEVWRAARLINGGLKDSHLTMLEWHARSNRQPAPDTWYEGHFLERWADPRALSELPALFAAGEPDALWDALFASLESFRRVAGETAQALGLNYMVELEAQIAREIQTLREPRRTEGI